MNAELTLTLPFPAGSTVSRYSVVTLVFFITYIIFQPPSTVLIRKLGPRLHLSVITTAWGAVMIGMGFVKDWESLAGLRVVLGILEAGFFPSVVYLLSTWYTRFDVGKRYSVFYMLGSLASACAGILAFGLMQLGGKTGTCDLPGMPAKLKAVYPCPGHAGLTGWRWIFIIEGALTCALGFGAYVALVDFPDKAHKSWRFLNEREAKFIIARVDRDRGDAKPEAFSAPKFFRAALDIKIWGYAMVSLFSHKNCAIFTNCDPDLLQHHHSDICAGLLLANHSTRQDGLHHRRIAMSCSSPLRFCRYHHVRHRLGR